MVAPNDDRVTRAGFDLLEHQADVGVRAWGETLEETFEQSGWAVADLLGVRGTGPGTPRTVRVTGTDVACVLVDFLNELLLLHETENMGFAAIRVLNVTGTELEARVELVPIVDAPEGISVKAATFHQLRVERLRDGTIEARVYLDV
ncbi:MAG: archease [Actinomycetota bacterium]